MTRSRIDHRADRPGWERLFLLAAPIIQQLIKQLKKKNASADRGTGYGL
jgi:hypothetical protein